MQIIDVSYCGLCNLFLSTSTLYQKVTKFSSLISYFYVTLNIIRFYFLFVKISSSLILMLIKFPCHICYCDLHKNIFSLCSFYPSWSSGLRFSSVTPLFPFYVYILFPACASLFFLKLYVYLVFLHFAKVIYTLPSYSCCGVITDLVSVNCNKVPKVFSWVIIRKFH